ncbi:MAG: nodulation protein NfeD [Rhodocyclaceae bacterium]|nr:nodulation protein NfeD [Rhodocyclaceae bacterium]
MRLGHGIYNGIEPPPKGDALHKHAGRILQWLILAIALCAPVVTAAAPSVRVLDVQGIVGPATASFVGRQLASAAQARDALVVLRMDTPGGLDSAMREIIQAILASPVPVATFVHPEGARAASAGTFILYASHIAAMAPATNLGAATPVAIGLSPADGASDTPADKGAPAERETTDSRPAAGGGAMMRKAVNDAAAYLRSLAELRGRDVGFAERAVREAASLSASEALAAGVIDVVVTDVPALLAAVDGRSVRIGGSEVTLATAGATIQAVTPGWQLRLLGALANPQLAVVLMMIGIYGLFFEVTSPGFGVPGIAGTVCLLLALYAFHMLPVNWVGVALIALGAGLMVAEAFLPSFGAFGVGGVLAFVLGGLFLMDAERPAFGLPLPFLAGMALLSAATLFAIGSLAARSRRRPPASGPQLLIGAPGRITTVSDEGCWAQVAGESWRVVGAGPLRVGDAVRVEAIDGLTLQVGTPHPDVN